MFGRAERGRRGTPSSRQCDNWVAPGPVDTDIMGGTLTEQRKQQLSEGMMIRRICLPEEVAALIAFLMGAEAGSITAAVYDINGGLHVS